MKIAEWFAGFFSGILRTIHSISIVDFIDIFFVAIILYYAFRFVRERRAGKLAVGVIFFTFFLVLSDLLGMHALKYIFQNLFQVGVLALVVLFQPEMRSALEKMGGSSLKGLKNISESKDNSVWMLAIREVSTAAAQMAAEKTGALIVFERGTRLGEIAATGTVCDAQVSAYLLRNMFFNKAPLHDGAVLLRNGRIHAAGCLLPLTQQDINRDLGTRHRAAIGLSENSDAAVVVVSEETGVISVAVDGYLTRGYNADTLRSRLTELVGPVSQVKENKKIFRFMRKGSGKNAERDGESER
ncbi:cyclic di-AMP synthase CdaA [Clostridiales bacterium]|jgi:diadenylate cyclase|nr:TIGR00159 family protein [Clostridiales bacterium]GFI55588.1 cyclic di-AMP synthase CdaA [Clostridiales bacterium]